MAAPAIIHAFGLSGLFLGVAAVSLAIAPFAGAFFETAPATSAQSRSSTALGPTVPLLVSLGVLFVANNAVWAYLERIADAAGLSHSQVGAALSVGQAMSLAFAIAAGVFERLDRRLAIGGGLILMGASAPLFALAPSFGGTIVGVAGFLGAICFVVPFYLGAFAAADPSGRLVVWAQSAITIGLMLGPPAAAAVIDASSTNTMIWLSVMVTLAALVLMVPALSRRAAADRTNGAADLG